jgi:WD40-like Beta Propeller Repeat
VQGPGRDDDGAFSPDGKWIAYSSVDGNTPQIFVQPFPATRARAQVSRNGGLQPKWRGDGKKWRGDGKELYFLAPDGGMMAVPIDTTNGLQPGIPQSLFVSGSVNVQSGGRQYSVTKDGKRFLVLIPRPSERGASPPSLTVVVNWLASEAR